MTASPTTAELLAMINALKADNAALKAAIPGPRALTCKVSEKGAMSVYGLGRFPITLYAGQWDRLIEAAPQLQAFLKANHGLLATKPATT